LITAICCEANVRALCLFLSLTFCLPFSLLAKPEAPGKGHAKAKVADQDHPNLENYPPLLIGPGDLLNITIYGEDDLPKDYIVDNQGIIVFPLVGEFKAAGLSQAEMSQVLAKSLKPFMKAPQVTVLITESANYIVTILGDVLKPGKYRIRGNPSVLNLIGEAGGPGPYPDLAGCSIIRDSRKMDLDLGNYLTKDHFPVNKFVLMPGDTIWVPTSPWPTIGEWGIIASILSSAVAVSVAISRR